LLGLGAALKPSSTSMHPDTKFRQFQRIGYLTKGIKDSCEQLMDELDECRKGYLNKSRSLWSYTWYSTEKQEI